MKYKNLNLAFLFEIIIGFGCIISVSLLGFGGLISLALIGLKPFFLEREPISDEKKYWRFSYRVMLSSLIIISLFIISIFILINLVPSLSKKLPPIDKILYLLIPFFFMTRGVIGFIYNQKID
jgi:hypothetical protein